MRPESILARLVLVIILLVASIIAVLVFALYRGVNVDSLSFGSVQIERLSAHLDGKLSLDIGRVAVTRKPSAAPENGPESEPDIAKWLNPSSVRNLLHGIHFLAKAFAHLDIEHIEVGSLRGNFRYGEKDTGHFNAHGPNVDIALDLSVEGDQLVVDIAQLKAPAFRIQGTGKMYLNPANRELRANLHAVIADILPAQLDITADSEQLSFSGQGLAPVASIAPIIEPFKLSAKITPWIVDYLRGSQFTLSEVSGTLPYDDPAKILQTLRAVAHVQDVSYTFDQALDPVLADEADVVFEQGFLHIYPKEITFYGQDGGSSYVDLNFNDHRFSVIVYVRTRAQLSPDINTLLAHYHIRLPFEQVLGQTNTDLTLTIDVSPAPVSVHTDGHFTTVDSEIQMGTQRYQVAKMAIALKDSLITFKQLDLGLADRFTASLTGEMDVSARQGALDIALNHFDWPVHSKGLSLQLPTEQPPVFHYHLDSEGDSIDVPVTSWRYGDTPLSVAAFTTAFDLSSISGELPATEVTLGNGLQGQVSGQYRSHAPFADLKIALQRINVAGVQLAQPTAALAVHVGKQVDVSTLDALKLSVKGLPVSLQPCQLSYVNGILQIKQSGLQIAPGLTTGLQGQWSVANSSGQLSLLDLNISNQSGSPMFVADEKLSLLLSRHGGQLHIKSPELALEVKQLAVAGWALNVADIRPLNRQSPLLQRFGIDGGTFQLTSPSGSSPYNLNGRLHLSYPLLVEGDTPMHDYAFTGTYQNKITHLTINEHFQVELAKTIQIDSTGLGFNLPALLNFAKQLSAAKAEASSTPVAKSQDAPARLTSAGGPESIAVARSTSEQGMPDESSTSAELRVRLHARDSFLWLAKNRRALASQLMVHYADGKVTGDMQYLSGYATLEWNDGILNMVGHGFDHTFTNHLIDIAHFDKGTFEFGARGSPNDLIAGLRIRNTVITDDKHLNNILAFIDTVPALLTFKVPHYDTEGMPVKEVYAKMSYKDKVVDLESLHIDSDELTVNGTGQIDLGHETTDMTFNVITGAKKSIQRIPLLGYVLAGGEKKPSITVTVKGDLHHPDISQSAFKEVVIYPFELIKRTILLPDHMVKKAQAQKQKKATESIPD
jgi:hypothetical protein